MKAKHLAGLFAVFAALLLMPAAYAVPMLFWGNATINVSGTYNITPDGANITVHINGSDRINNSVKVGVGVYFYNTTASGYYMTTNVTCNPGDNVSFRVYNVTALINNSLSGYTCSLDPTNTTYGAHLYLNITALQNSSFCTDNKACITGVCGSDYDGTGSWCVPSGSCAHNGAVRTSGYVECADTSTLKTCTSGSWETTTCTSCLGGICTNIQSVAPTTSAPAPTPTPPTETSITDTPTITQLIQGLKPQDLGLTTLAAADVTVKQIGSAAESTVQTTATIADLAVQMATDATAKAAIEAIKTDVAAGNSVDVKVSLTVYKVESPSTGQSVYVSKVELKFTATSQMSDVNIVQVIPKSIASTIANVTFLSGTPTVLQSDPIVKWNFATVNQGETKDMSYTVKKQLSGTAEVTTLAAAGIIERPLAVCITGNKRCSEGKIEQCADGKTWQTIEVCNYGCDDLSLKCNPAPGVTAPEAEKQTTFTYAIAVIIVAVLLLALWVFKRKAH